MAQVANGPLVGFLPPNLRMKEHGVFFNGGLYSIVDDLQPVVTHVIYRLDMEAEEL